MDSAWNQVTGTVAAEFSDLTDLSDATRIVVRLLVAGVLGGTLGWEREHAGKAAGVRTHMLVAMGAALFVLVSQQIGIESPDMSRVVQGIIAGIGFLGAGTILKGTGDEKVHGLTTAAASGLPPPSVWRPDWAWRPPQCSVHCLPWPCWAPCRCCSGC
jgi:putative Mg2+ transporter-C (MgtC) family protein